MAVKTNCEINGVKYCRKTKTIGKNLDGTPKKKQFYGKSEKDVDEQIEKYMNMKNKGAPDDFDQVTIQELMQIWLFNVLYPSKNQKSASFEKHEANYRLYIQNSDIGFLKVYDILTLPIQNFYNKLYIELNLTSAKIFDINKTLRKFFNWCKTSHYIVENPCSLSFIQIPGDADGEEDEADYDIDGVDIDVFSDEDVQKIMQYTSYCPSIDNTFNTSIKMDFLSGLRKGELLGLKKKFVDIATCTIKVRNTLKIVKVFDTPTQYHRELRLTKPKTKSSVRNVDFPSNFKNALILYFEDQEKKWASNGLEFNEDSLIFTTDSCLPLNGSNYNRAWKRFLARNNLPNKKFHNIRDTYATTLFRKGARLTDVRDLLGHSTIETTEKYYIYVFPTDKKNTVSLLDNLVD